MKKKVFFLVLIIVIAALFFTPATLQETISVKKSFLAVYAQLASPASWERWRPDLKSAFLADSNKIAVKKDTSSFTINYDSLRIEVHPKGGLFDVDERGGKSMNYSYAIGPDKQLGKTLITVYKNTNFAHYLLAMIAPVSFADTHINDFKHFMETDSLYYGYNIFKARIPGDKLLVIIKQVLTKNKFETGAKMLEDLKRYINTNNIKTTQPVISQFIPKGKDSTLIKVGFFIDREVKSTGEISFERMPKGAAVYCAILHGKFNEKPKIYASLNKYMNDHLYQIALLPFETYFDNKLPASDTSRVNLRVNFGSYF